MQKAEFNLLHAVVMENKVRYLSLMNESIRQAFNTLITRDWLLITRGNNFPMDMQRKWRSLPSRQRSQERETYVLKIRIFHNSIAYYV